MLSSGQGADLALDFLTVPEITSMVISSQLNSATGARGDGIHSVNTHMTLPTEQSLSARSNRSIVGVELTIPVAK